MVRPLQKQLLDALLKEDVSELLRPLDPSRCPEAIRNYYYEWHGNWEEIRYSHSSVSSVFLHGHGHHGQPLESLTTQLVSNPQLAEGLPPLVAVQLEGRLYVIMGNRRLKCLKEAWNRGATCWFRIIVHDFPKCDAITDLQTKGAFRLKSLQAASSQNEGLDVEMHPKKRQRRW